jgi:hypothetical protein
MWFMHQQSCGISHDLQEQHGNGVAFSGKKVFLNRNSKGHSTVLTFGNARKFTGYQSDNPTIQLLIMYIAMCCFHKPSGELRNGQRSCECWAAGLANQHSWHFEQCMPMINCSSGFNRLQSYHMCSQCRCCMNAATCAALLPRI